MQRNERQNLWKLKLRHLKPRTWETKLGEHPKNLKQTSRNTKTPTNTCAKRVSKANSNCINKKGNAKGD